MLAAPAPPPRRRALGGTARSGAPRPGSGFEVAPVDEALLADLGAGGWRVGRDSPPARHIVARPRVAPDWFG